MRGTLKYAAASIVPADDCCTAAAELEGMIFLAVEAPRLPLHGCTRPHLCDCKYRKYPDRRTGSKDRRGPRVDEESVCSGDDERRLSRGRRSDD